MSFYQIKLLRASIVYTTKYHTYHAGLSSKFIGFSQRDTEVTLNYNAPLSEAEQAAIQDADVSFVDNDPLDYIRRTILVPARSFGQQILDEFASENILLGITAAGKTNHVRKTMKEVVDCLNTGSLYDAIHETRQIPSEAKDPVFLSDARLLFFINKLEDYLQLPKSNNL